MDNIIIKAPWWFWGITVFMVVWNFIGPVDFYNSVTLNEAYLSAYPGMLEFIQDMPLWAKVAWGTAVFSAFIGSVCLLLRRKIAFNIYVLAIIAMVISFAYQWTAPNKVTVEPWVHVFTAVIWLIAFFQLWFARRMIAKGILR